MFGRNLSMYKYCYRSDQYCDFVISVVTNNNFTFLVICDR